MREWNLKPSDPLAVTLSADAALGPTLYSDDQTWELVAGGDPPALAIQTTFGLRARALRLFPRFIEGDSPVADPAEFSAYPVVQHLYPNFLGLAYSPFADIDVQAEYWVPQSQALAGRIKMTNTSRLPRRLRLEWIAQLSPTSGQRMANVEIESTPVLAGQTDGLAPVVFLTGGPQPGGGSFPALSLALDLSPGESRRVTWSQAALGEVAASFALARSLAARKWDSERARIELLNAGRVEIYTGDPDWDAAFWLAQVTAFRLFLNPVTQPSLESSPSTPPPPLSSLPSLSGAAPSSTTLPSPSFVLSRQADQGHSLRGDGSDYNHLWNGQTPLDAYYLAGLILPSAPHLAQGLLRNFLAAQSENGFVDWKPGLAGQRSLFLATPLLAGLAWRIFEFTEDQAFLREVFPGLVKFFDAWFDPLHDRDGDGLPEWDHPMQAGVEDHPLYSHWHPWSQGVDISTAETPALCAFLFQEAQALISIANLLEQAEPVPALQAAADKLKAAVDQAWDPEECLYYDWDRDSHANAGGTVLGEIQGPGTLLIQNEFPSPVRLQLTVHTSGETTRRPDIFIHGLNPSGDHRIEHLSTTNFRWYLGRGAVTSQRVYAAVEMVEVQGLDQEDRIRLETIDYRCPDQSALLPLWAGMLPPDRAAALIERAVLEPARFWHPYGLPACARSPHLENSEAIPTVHLPWNALAGAGLLRYGYRQEAAELVAHLMDAVIHSLKRDGVFHRAYHADTGAGLGERNALPGLAPLGLFLETLGVRLISSHRVALHGFNPFPWPVTVKYRGMTVLRQKAKTMVIFPDGQTAVVTDPSPQVISLE